MPMSMEIKPVRDEQTYREALREIAVLMETDPALGTPEGDRLEVLSTLVEAYEARTFPMDVPDPSEGGCVSRHARAGRQQERAGRPMSGLDIV